jgi:dihydropteroate synthase
MSTVLVIVLNIILLFIVFVILMNRIKKQSAPRVLDEYAKEVEALIVELNNAVDQAVNISEERIKELKRCIRKAERVIKDPKLDFPATDQEDTNQGKERPPETRDRTNLMEKTRHLLAMGYTKVDIAKKLNITAPEVEFLQSLSKE